MKTNQLAFLLLAIALISITTACQKNVDVQQSNNITGNAVQADKAFSNNPFNHNECLVASTVDDIYGLTTKVFYNNHQNPDSVQFGSYGLYTVVPDYDRIGRMKAIRFSTAGHINSSYELLTYENGVNPTKLSYIVPNYVRQGFPDSLNAVFGFKYNLKGEVTQITYDNLYYQGYDYVENFEYDGNGNVTTVQLSTDWEGSFTEYQFNSYDDKPNMMGGNFWLKYLLFDHYQPFYELIFSKNNAKDFNWYFDPTMYGWKISNQFEYNDNGFANKILHHSMDTDGNFIGDFTQSSLSTCDVATSQSLQATGSLKSSLQQKLQQIHRPVIQPNGLLK